MNRNSGTIWIYSAAIACFVVTATGCSHSSTTVTDAPLKKFSQAITSQTKTLTLKPGEQVFVPVTIKNTGTEVWAANVPTNPVHLSYLWFNGPTQLEISTTRTFLPADLPPGAEQALQANVSAPPTAGHYILKFTMVQERVAWFLGAGADPLAIPVTVQ